MDLDWSEEQQMLREMVRGVCRGHSPIAVVRAMEDDPIGYPAEGCVVPEAALAKKPLEEIMVVDRG